MSAEPPRPAPTRSDPVMVVVVDSDEFEDDDVPSPETSPTHQPQQQQHEHDGVAVDQPQTGVEEEEDDADYLTTATTIRITNLVLPQQEHRNTTTNDVTAAEELPPISIIAPTVIHPSSNNNNTDANKDDNHHHHHNRDGSSNNNNADDDDISSKAAVALAAVAAAATANHKSPAEAAREARGLAQSFISQASAAAPTTSSHSGGGGGGEPLPTVPLSTVKTHLRQRLLETGSTVTDRLCQGDNDAFLQHLLLLEHFRCMDDTNDTLGGATIATIPSADDGDTMDDASLRSESSRRSNKEEKRLAAQACERVEALLKRVEGAYDSLIDLLPSDARRRQQPTPPNLLYDDDEDNDWETKGIMVPDLLPPCTSESGDSTVAFFRACLGAAANELEHSTTITNASSPSRNADATTEFSAATSSTRSSSSNSAGSSSTSTRKTSPISPPSSPGGRGGGVFSSMFKRGALSSSSGAGHNASSVTSSGKGGAFHHVFRKSRRASESGTVSSSEATASGKDATASSSSSGHDSSTNSHLRPGEYIVKIEREMLGLTVENVLERTVVRTVVPGGPAKKAGAKVGSLIVKVGNVETKHLTHFETIDELRQSNRPLQLVMRQISDDALRSAREEMGRLIKGSGFGAIMDGQQQRQNSNGSDDPSRKAQSSGDELPPPLPLPTGSGGRQLIAADLRIDAYTNLLRRRLAEAVPSPRNKKEEALIRVGDKLVWILTLFVIGLEREAAHLYTLADSNSHQHRLSTSSSSSHLLDPPLSPRKQTSMYHHSAKDYTDAAKSVSKVLLDYVRKKIDPARSSSSNNSYNPGLSSSIGKLGSTPHGLLKRTKGLPPPPPLPGRVPRPNSTASNQRGLVVPGRWSDNDSSLTHDKPLLQIGDVLQRTRTFLADPTSPPAALLRGELIAFLCDVLDIDTEMELAEEEAVSSYAGVGGGGGAGAGGITDLGSAGSLLKVIVLNCPIMRSACCEALSAKKARGDDPEVQEELLRRFGPASGKVTATSFDLHRLHAGNRFLAVVHRLAASRSTSARITACSLGPVIWGHLDFPHQLQLRGVITRALHDVEVIVRKSTATVLHEVAELVFDGRSVPWLVLMCERAMTDPEPQLRSAAMTLTWHLAEHLPNAFLGDPSQGSRYLRRLPSREDPLFADVYLLQCKLLPVATRLAEDRSPSVRLAVAAQSDRLCDALGDHWSSVIIDVLLGLLSDSDERVRCEAVSCVPRLSQIVMLSAPPGETAVSEVSILEALIPAASKLQKDSSVSVRVALAAAAGELLTLLVAMQRRATESLNLSHHSNEPHPGHDSASSPSKDSGKKYKSQVDDRLIPMVQLLLNDADPEVTSAALRAVTNATRSSVQHARNRLVSVASNDDDASLSSYQSHASRSKEPVFLPVLSENQVLRLLPTLNELAESRQWRVRQSAVEIVPALLGCTTMLETRTEISKLCVRLMSDQVDAVRKTAAECLCMGGSSLGSHGEDAGGEWITSIVIPAVRKCAVHSHSKQRLLSLKMVEVILLNGVCPNKWYSTPKGEENLADSPTRELVTIALSLTADRIANVRLNVGRILETVIHVFEEQDIDFIKVVLQEQIASEKAKDGGGDRDVVYFSNRCIQRALGVLAERAQGPARDEVAI